MIAGIICITIMAVIIFVFFNRQIREEKAARREQEKRLEDESIYDPSTGAKMDLEQAENDLFINHDFVLRVKSDQEIEENYLGDEREIEYIKRHFAKAGIHESENEELINLIYQSKNAKQFKTFDIYFLWEWKPGYYVGLIYISYEYLSGRSLETTYEMQLFVVLNHLTTANAKEVLHNFEDEQTPDWVIFRLPGKAKYSDLMLILNKL